MSDQEKSLRRYMAVLADELNKCKDPGKAKRYAVELTRSLSYGFCLNCRNIVV